MLRNLIALIALPSLVVPRRAKQKSGFDFAARHQRRLWQKGYFERIVRDDEPTTELIRYIIANPVRAG